MVAILKSGLIVVGIAPVGAVAVSVVGNNVVAGCGGCPGGNLLPGLTSTDSGPIVVGKVFKTRTNADGSIGIENPEDLTANAGSN